MLSLVMHCDYTVLILNMQQRGRGWGVGRETQPQTFRPWSDPDLPYERNMLVCVWKQIISIKKYKTNNGFIMVQSRLTVPLSLARWINGIGSEVKCFDGLMPVYLDLAVIPPEWAAKSIVTEGRHFTEIVEGLLE